MTPKSQRVPKHGEILLSVHGSPLGVYKEDNMEAIHGMLQVFVTLLLSTANSEHACLLHVFSITYVNKYFDILWKHSVVIILG